MKLFAAFTLFAAASIGIVTGAQIKLQFTISRQQEPGYPVLYETVGLEEVEFVNGYIDGAEGQILTISEGYIGESNQIQERRDPENKSSMKWAQDVCDEMTAAFGASGFKATSKKLDNIVHSHLSIKKFYYVITLTPVHRSRRI